MTRTAVATPDTTPDEAWIAVQLTSAPEALTEQQTRTVARALAPPADPRSA